MARRTDVQPEKRGFITRIGTRAAFAVGTIGLVFAAYQVQGWTMPDVLAAVLILVLLGSGAVALVSIAWEAIKEIGHWRERRETSSAWIAAESPGLLDLDPDMKRATKKFSRQMSRINRDTERLGNKTKRSARNLTWVRLLGGRATQIWANEQARSVSRSAVFLEKRLGPLRKTVDELRRTQESRLNTLGPIETDEARAALAELRPIAASRTETIAETIESVVVYRDAVLGLAHQNVARTLTVANKQLAERLDEVITILRRSLKDSERTEATLDRMAKP